MLWWILVESIARAVTSKIFFPDDDEAMTREAVVNRYHLHEIFYTLIDHT